MASFFSLLDAAPLNPKVRHGGFHFKSKQNFKEKVFKGALILNERVDGEAGNMWSPALLFFFAGTCYIGKNDKVYRAKSCIFKNKSSAEFPIVLFSQVYFNVSYCVHYIAC